MRATASRTALWMLCAYGMRDDVEQDPDRPNEWRAFGLAVHDVLEVIRQGWAPDLLAIADKRELTATQRLALPLAVQALRDLRVPQGAMSEVAWAIDLDTGEGRILGEHIGRAYKEHGARDGVDFCGSADIAWMATTEAHRGYVVVVDLKSGYEGTVEDHKPQLMSNAAGLALALGARGAILHVLHLFNGEIRPDAQIVEDYDLRIHVAALQARRKETPTAEPNPGPHCREKYCTAIGSCPAGQRAIAELLPADRLTVKLHGKIESLAEARARIDLLPLLKERVKQWEQDCQEWEADHGPVRLADGTYYAAYPSEKRSIEVTPEAMAVLADELGDEGAQRAYTLSITQTSIRRQLEAAGVKPASSAVARILERLDRAGALSTKKTWSYDYRTHPPRERREKTSEANAARTVIAGTDRDGVTTTSPRAEAPKSPGTVTRSALFADVDDSPL